MADNKPKDGSFAGCQPRSRSRSRGRQQRSSEAQRHHRQPPASSPSPSPASRAPQQQQQRQQHSHARSSSHPHSRKRRRPRAPHAAAQPQSRAAAAAFSSSSSDSDSFLLTAVERAERRQRREQQQQQQQSERKEEEKDVGDGAGDGQEEREVRPIPGYYYDRQQRRYFKIAVGHDFEPERRLQRLDRAEKAERKRREEEKESERLGRDSKRLWTSRRQTERGSLGFPAAADAEHERRQLAEYTASHPSSSLPALLLLRSAEPTRLQQNSHRLQSALFSLLSPTLLFSATPSPSSSSLSSLPSSAGCGLAFDSSSSSLSTCGSVVEQEEQREDAQPGFVRSKRMAAGSFHSVYQLHISDAWTRRSNAETRQESTGDEIDFAASAPFTTSLLHRHETVSPITSSHLLTAPPSTFAPSRSSSPSLSSSLFFPSPSSSSRLFLLETLLGSSSQLGSFKLLHLDHHVRSACLLPAASAFSSSPHPLFMASSPRVAIGGSRGVCVFQCEREERRWLACGKSDQLSVEWRTAGDELYAGGRNGCVRLFDLRRGGGAVVDHRGAAGVAAAAVSLLQRVPDTHSIVVAAGSSLGLYDERSWTADGGRGLVLQYAEWSSEWGCGRVALAGGGQWLMAADDRGTARVWELRSGRLLREIRGGGASSLLSGAGGGRAGGEGGGQLLHHSVWLDAAQSLLVGSEQGVSCYSLQS